MKKSIATASGWRAYARKSYAVERNLETKYPMIHVFDNDKARDDWAYRNPPRRDRHVKIERVVLTEKEACVIYGEYTLLRGGSRPVVHKALAV